MTADEVKAELETRERVLSGELQQMHAHLEEVKANIHGHAGQLMLIRQLLEKLKGGGQP